MIQKETCTPVFTAALFTRARTWKHGTCPWTEDWMKMMWHTHAMDYYSAIKKNGIRPFTAMWMDLDSVTLSEVRQRRNI